MISDATHRMPFADSVRPVHAFPWMAATNTPSPAAKDSVRLIRLLLMRYRLRLARYSLRASMCLAMIGKRLYRL
jgi:hypothetical protein